MPDVTRRTSAPNRNEGFVVETHSGGDTYEYVLERTDPDGDEVEVVERYHHTDGHREEKEPKSTESVRDVMDERGFSVAN